MVRRPLNQDGCSPDFIDTREAVPVLAAYLLAFGRRHVLGQTEWDAILTGPPLGNEGDFVVTESAMWSVAGSTLTVSITSPFPPMIELIATLEKL